MIRPTKIPKIIHYTFENNNLTNDILKIIYNNKIICTDYKFCFFEKKDRDCFIFENFNSKVYNAYKSINSKLGVCQSDFWRYCVLYVCGGIYIDIKTKILINIKNIINKKDQFVLDFPKNIYEKPCYDQGVLMCAPKHPYNILMIKKITEEINQRKFPKISHKSAATPIKQIILRFTGPLKLGDVISEFSNRNPIHRCIDIKSFFYYDYEAISNLYIYNNMNHYSNSMESLYYDTPLKVDYFD